MSAQPSQEDTPNPLEYDRTLTPNEDNTTNMIVPIIDSEMEPAHRGSTDSKGRSFFRKARSVNPQLSSAEAEYIEQIFNEFDADHSGSIDIFELRNVMEAMGHMLTESQLKELVDQVDVSGTGNLNLVEFIHMICLWKEAAQLKLLDTDAPSIQQQRIDNALRSTHLFIVDSTFRWIWDGTIFIAIFYMWVWTLYHEVTSTTQDLLKKVLLGPDIVVSVLFAADIAVVLSTSVKINDRITLDTFLEVFFYHAKRFLAIDILAIPPFLLFGDHIVWKILGFVRLLKALKIASLFGSSGKRHMTTAYIKFYFNMLPIIKQLVVFFMLTHLCAILWSVLKDHGPDFEITLPESEKDVKYDTSHSWSTSVYFVMYTLTTCGYGNVVVQGPYQQVFACFLCLCGTIMNGLVIGMIVSVMQKTDIKSERATKLRETLAVCQYFGIPKSLEGEILEFQNHVLEHNLSAAYTDLIRGLPSDMQVNLGLYVRIGLVTVVPFFKSAHEGTRVAIAQKLTTQVFLPETYIIIAGDDGDCMYFIAYGFVDVFTTEGKRLATLKQGDFFGERAVLLKNQKRMATIKALTYCDTFVLKQNAFDEVLSRFPKFREAVLMVAQQRCEGDPELQNAFQNASPITGSDLAYDSSSPKVGASEPATVNQLAQDCCHRLSILGKTLAQIDALTITDLEESHLAP